MGALDLERFIVHNKLEVLQILNDLSKHKAIISGTFNHGRDVFVTTVIGVDYDKQVAYLDVGRDEEFNRRLLASPRTLFTYSGRIRVQWTSADIHTVNLSSGEALMIDLPSDLIRVQRREFFRLPTPIVNPVICRIPVGPPPQGDDVPEKILELPLADISIGGICVTSLGSVDTVLTEGAEFHNCKMELPGVGATNLSLRIKRVSQSETKDGGVKFYLGMEFVNPSRGNQSLIQRYVFNLEREAAATAPKI